MIMIAAKYNTSEGKVQILPVLRTMAAVIVARRRNRNNEQRRRERIFLVRVSIFGMTEEKIIQTYRLTSHAILELLNDLQADLEPTTKRRLRLYSDRIKWSAKTPQGCLVSFN